MIQRRKSSAGNGELRSFKLGLCRIIIHEALDEFRLKFEKHHTEEALGCIHE